MYLDEACPPTFMFITDTDYLMTFLNSHTCSCIHYILFKCACGVLIPTCYNDLKKMYKKGNGKRFKERFIDSLENLKYSIEKPLFLRNEKNYFLPFIYRNIHKWDWTFVPKGNLLSPEIMVNNFLLVFCLNTKKSVCSMIIWERGKGNHFRLKTCYKLHISEKLIKCPRIKKKTCLGLMALNSCLEKDFSRILWSQNYTYKRMRYLISQNSDYESYIRIWKILVIKKKNFKHNIILS